MPKTPKLGQHFLTSRKVVKKIVEIANITADDTVLEIGPGKGVLTRELLTNEARVIAVEKDHALYKKLLDEFSDEVDSDKLKLIEDDVRNFNPKDNNLLTNNFILVANIPYYLTGGILRRFVGGDVKPKQAVLLVQKEVADRIVARDGKESILSILVKAYGEPKYKGTVKKTLFSPKPRVDSAILSIENISGDFFEDIDESTFIDLVKKGFSQKRKKLSKNLGMTAENLDSCGVNENARAEDLNLAQWKCLVKFMG